MSVTGTNPSSVVRNTYDVRGTVQGVGFRPAIHRLATRLGLGGWIQNRSDSVRICLEGPAQTIDRFVQALPASLPPGALLHSLKMVDSIRLTEKPTATFRIASSSSAGNADVLIPSDIAMCRACENDILDPANRRFAYPFTTCADCGPRYTIVHSAPFDRSRTTMARFRLCAECRREYRDPRNRRFHAETIACPQCGPHLRVETADGAAVTGDPLTVARSALHAGLTLALRSIGGFHLAVDAFNQAAVAALRRRKQRPDKPFAVMAANLAVVERFCRLTPRATQLLRSREAPIVILDLRPEALAIPAVRQICPDSDTLGVFLPLSPLHRLLMTHPSTETPHNFDLLVMTSGNRGGEPVCTANPEARKSLAEIADLFLFHNRDIHLRNEDSICRSVGNSVQVWRRGRGYSPTPLPLHYALPATILGMGAELKNTVSLGFANQIVSSTHIGDLDTPAALDAHLLTARTLSNFLRKPPHTIACDLHPDLNATRNAHILANQVRCECVTVQHHHAHAAACMAENGLNEALALVFDGTGLGTDGRLWGAELLHVTGPSFNRLATFAPVPLPGGDAAVRRPARQLVGRIIAAGSSPSANLLQRLGISDDELEVWRAQTLSPSTLLTHSAGRLFDSFSTVLGLTPREITYDGQAAVRLETAARRHPAYALRIPYTTTLTQSLLTIDWTPAFNRLLEPGFARDFADELPWACHASVVDAAMDMIRHAAALTATRSVVLSGGCFMNTILNELLLARIADAGLVPYVHSLIPPNDACISVGQVVVAGLLNRK